jgi:hypothetical protein
MRYTQPLSLKEYYLWRKNAEATYPWKRLYLDHQFLEYEKKRITKVSEWHIRFLKTDANTVLDETSFYTIPVELSTTWKAAIANFGDYSYIGLSALYNTPQALLIALLPNTLRLPKDFRLILIKRAKKINIFNERLNEAESVILIEDNNDWEYLRSDSVYLYQDIQYEKNIIQKTIEENLIQDEQISRSFQSPIVSAPYTDGSVGGISLSSLAGSSSFAKELSKTIQRMVPPEYREFKPPKSAYLGDKFDYLSGIKYHLAERPYVEGNVLSSFCSPNYGGLADKLSYRHNFAGEYSIFSTLSPNEGDVTQVWNELMSNFAATEVTLPENIDDLPLSDIELTKLIDALNEDLWVQLVYARQKRPDISEGLSHDVVDMARRLENDFDVLLTDVIRQEDSREFMVRSMLLHPSHTNLMRLSQSFARSEGKDTVVLGHLKQARKMIVANFEGFVSHPEFRQIRLSMKRRRNDAQYSVVQTEIINHPRSSAGEIFESVISAGLFRDIYDLQGLLDWLNNRGYVIVDRNKKYTWVGSPDELFSRR